MEFFIVQLDFSAVLDRVSHSGRLFKLKPIGVGGSMLSFVGSSSPTVGIESWLMVLLVSGSQSFLASRREVRWVLFCSFLYQ